MNNFNIRVYALIFDKENRLMILNEDYACEHLVKLPGGGLEYGEGVIDALRREIKEELNLDLASYQHFYTQEDFITPRFKKEQQLLSIYYKVEVMDLLTLKILEPSIHSVGWIDRNEECPFSLPVDCLVYSLFQGLKSR